jgi:hypothetical protein
MKEIDRGLASTGGATDGSTAGGIVSADSDGRTLARAKGGIAEPGEQKKIWPDAQSINGLCQVSQLYPSTTEQAESRGVTYNSTGVESPEGKETSIRTFSAIIVPRDPLKTRSLSGGIGT